MTDIHQAQPASESNEFVETQADTVNTSDCNEENHEKLPDFHPDEKDNAIKREKACDESRKVATSKINDEHCTFPTNPDSSNLHPFVHWSQSQSHITLRVDLIQAEDLEVDSKFSCQPIQRYVLIVIKKETEYKWPRLTKQQARPPWLRIDFDRYGGKDSDSEDNISSEEESYSDNENSIGENQCSRTPFNSEQQPPSDPTKILEQVIPNNSLNHIVKKNNSDIFNPFKKRQVKSPKMKYDYRTDGDIKLMKRKANSMESLDFQKTYLFIYNLVMFVMFLKVYVVLLIRTISGTMDDDTIQGTAFIIKILTYTQLLETIHPVLGLVPGGPMMPFLQVIGRLLVNHFLSEPTIRLDAFPYAHLLFIVWSSIEIFRYSFYALRVFKLDIYPLTWCRYTLFMPLYPMGGFCESMVIFSTIRRYEETGEYSVSLPNAANISFNLPIMLRVYTFLLLGPSIYFLMKYMWKQRCKQLKDKTD